MLSTCCNAPAIGEIDTWLNVDSVGMCSECEDISRFVDDPEQSIIDDGYTIGKNKDIQ